MCRTILIIQMKTVGKKTAEMKFERYLLKIYETPRWCGSVH